MPPRRTARGRAGLSTAPPARLTLGSQEVEHDNAQEDTALGPTPNERLLQAVKYLSEEDIHSAERFKERLGLIEEHILRKYRADGIAFNPQLYNQVKALVAEHKESIEAVEKKDFLPAHPRALSGDSDSDADMDPETPTALERSHEVMAATRTEQESKARTISLLNRAFSRSENRGAPVEAGRTTLRRFSQQELEVPDPATLEENVPGYHSFTMPQKQELELLRIDELRERRIQTLNHPGQRQTGISRSAPIQSSTAGPPWAATNLRSAKPVPEPRRRRGPQYAKDHEKMWEYGGPGNEPEVWHADMPPDLPFNETIHLANYKSVMIDNDLYGTHEKDTLATDKCTTVPAFPKSNCMGKGKGKGKETATYDDSIKHTRVPCLNENFGPLELWESGTHFRLPNPGAELINYALQKPDLLNQSKALQKINTLTSEDIEKRKFAPRKQLPVWTGISDIETATWQDANTEVRHDSIGVLPDPENSNHGPKHDSDSDDGADDSPGAPPPAQPKSTRKLSSGKKFGTIDPELHAIIQAKKSPGRRPSASVSSASTSDTAARRHGTIDPELRARGQASKSGAPRGSLGRRPPIPVTSTPSSSSTVRRASWEYCRDRTNLSLNRDVSTVVPQPRVPTSPNPSPAKPDAKPPSPIASRTRGRGKRKAEPEVEIAVPKKDPKTVRFEDGVVDEEDVVEVRTRSKSRRARRAMRPVMRGRR